MEETPTTMWRNNNNGNQRYQPYNTDNRPPTQTPPESNHILFFTVKNPKYKINVWIIQKICKLYNVDVTRVLMVRKNAVQAFVEFTSVEDATMILNSLQNADIYRDSCTLHIEYARAKKLHIFPQGDDSWDFTKGSNEKEGSRTPLLVEPGVHSREGYANTVQAEQQFEPDEQYQRSNSSMPPHGHQVYPANGHFPPTMGNGTNFSYPPAQQGSVAMIYNLHIDKMYPDRLFNLMCLYGNVINIKFLSTKAGCAMVQMGAVDSVVALRRMLHDEYLFGEKISVGISKQAFISRNTQPYLMSNGSESAKIFWGNENNRFLTPERVNKNRVMRPTQVLHFFNAPPNVAEEDVQSWFQVEDSTLPTDVKIFETTNTHCSSGLVFFEQISDATQALVVCNHKEVSVSGSCVFTLKLCFSSHNPGFVNE